MKNSSQLTQISNGIITNLECSKHQTRKEITMEAGTTTTEKFGEKKYGLWKNLSKLETLRNSGLG